MSGDAEVSVPSGSGSELNDKKAIIDDRVKGSDGIRDAESSMPTKPPAGARDLASIYPDRVQIHLTPSSSSSSSTTSFASSSFSSSSSNPPEHRPMGLVWSVSSVRLLRRYGIVGTFTGTLAQIPQQNVFLGLPIQLLDEEIVYLLRHGLAVVVDESKSYQTPTKKQLDDWNIAWQNEREHQQREVWKQRKALQAKYATKKDCADTKEQQEGEMQNVDVDMESVPEPTSQELESLPWYYTIPSTSSPSSTSASGSTTDLKKGITWYTPRVSTLLSSVQEFFTYPQTPEQVASCALYEHLKDMHSMWIMSGLRFGGKFSVYPGDPLRFHSHYTAQLVLPSKSSNSSNSKVEVGDASGDGDGGEDQSSGISIANLIANGRLGTAVKKTHLYCCVTKFHISFEDTTAINQPLHQIKDGSFDRAPPRTNGSLPQQTSAQDDSLHPSHAGRSFADFNTYSLAWAGFGT